MTRGELRQLMLYWVDDLDAGYFTATQCNTFLNNAQYEVQKQLIQGGELWYNKCATTTLVVNTGCYALPADFLKVNRLQILTNIGSVTPNQNWMDMEPLSLGEMSVYNYGLANGLPCVFTIGKDSLIIKQLPDQAYTIKMDYSYRVDPMNDDLNVPDVPEQYQEYIALTAALDCYLKDERDPSNLLVKKKEYMEMMKKDEIQRQRAKPRRVVRTQTDDGGWVGF